jgi:hypothetical protein
MFGTRSKAYDEGYINYMLGLEQENPYPMESKDWKQWFEGRNDAFDYEAQRELEEGDEYIRY